MSYINNNTYHINSLINNLSFKKAQKINIIMEGGLFNGSYLIGSLYYLKELEKRKYIIINKFSGCSVGSLIPLIYFTNTYDLEHIIYKITYSHFKKKLNVNIFDKIFNRLRPFLTPEVMTELNGRLYITFYDITQNRQIIKNKYESVDALFDTIRKSCYCPYVVDNSFLYRHKYVDGFYPYLFKEAVNIKNLYLNIHHFDKILGIISIKNEKTNYSRIISGIIDTHTFFMYGSSTSMCSYIENWNMFDTFSHFVFVRFLKIIPLLLHNIYISTRLIKTSTIIGPNIVFRILRILYVYLIKKYCI